MCLKELWDGWILIIMVPDTNKYQAVENAVMITLG
jgi:hypothetical protein